MVPPSPGTPLSPRLLRQLSLALRALEGARRSEGSASEEVGQALQDLKEFSGLLEETGEDRLPEGTLDEVRRAREFLANHEVDSAREVLLGVGRSFDDFMSGT